MKDVAVRILTATAKKLPHNIFASELLRKVRESDVNFVFSGEERTNFISEISLNVKSDNLQQAENDSYTIDKDFRIKTVRISNFRKYAQGKDGACFKMVASKDETPCSCLCIGSNGSGKTSLFSAMEKVFTDQISMAKLYNLTDKAESSSYIRNIMDKTASPSLEIETISETFRCVEPNYSTTFPLTRLARGFFCSEYDISELERNKDGASRSQFLYSQFGYGYIHEILQELEREAQEMKTLNDRYDVLYKQTTISTRIDYNKIDKIIFCDLLKICFPEVSEERLSIRRDTFSAYEADIEKEIYRKELIEEMDNLCEKDDWKTIVDMIKVILNHIRKDLNKIPVRSSEWKKETIKMEKILESLNTKLEELQSSDASLPDIGYKYNNLKKQVRDDIKLYLSDEFAQKRKYYWNTIFDLYRQIKDNPNKLSIINEFLNNFELNIQELFEEDEKKRKIEDIRRKIHEYEKFSISLNETKEAIKIVLQEELKDIKKNIQNGFDLMLKDFMEEYDDKFFVDIDKTDIVVQIKVHDCEELQSPRVYLNTFRFKLYCICLKICLAFDIKRQFNVNLPLVMDDLFYASDFHNREKVSTFIENILKYHDSIMGKEIPLQLIFLTHDEVIWNASRKGIDRYNEKNKEGIYQKFLFGRVMSDSEKSSDSNESTIIRLMKYGTN